MQHPCKFLAAAILLSGSATTQAQIYKATMSGANEVPPVSTTGSGVAVVSLNTTTHEMRVATNFQVVGNISAAHIHCCAAPGSNAGVATMTPSFTRLPDPTHPPTSIGSYDTTFNMSLPTSWNAAFINANGGTPAGAEATLSTALNSSMAYLNIHSSIAPGGEIRGNLTRFSFVPAANAATASLATALDSLGAGSGFLNGRLTSLAMLDNAGQRAAMELLLPVPTSVLAQTLSNALYADYDQIGNRLASMRGNAEGSVWVRYADRQNEYDLALRGAVAEGDGWDVTAGADGRMPSGWMMGFALSYSEDSVEYNGAMAGSASDLEGWRATVYAEHAFGGAYVEGMLTMGQGDTESLRGFGRTSVYVGSGESDQWGARIAAGTDLAIGTGLTVTPQVRLDWSNVDFGSYQEAVVTGMPLNVSSTDVDSMRVAIGGQVDWEASASFIPFVRAFYHAELEDDAIATTASFSAGNAFTVGDTGPESSGFTAGLGVNFAGSAVFAASLSYDLIDNDTFESEILQAKAMWRF